MKQTILDREKQRIFRKSKISILTLKLKEILNFFFS